MLCGNILLTCMDTMVSRTLFDPVLTSIGVLPTFQFVSVYDLSCRWGGGGGVKEGMPYYLHLKFVSRVEVYRKAFRCLHINRQLSLVTKLSNRSQMALDGLSERKYTKTKNYINFVFHDKTYLTPKIGVYSFDCFF